MRLAGRCLVVRQPAILRHDRILVPLSRRFLFLPVLRPSCTFFFSNLSSLSRTACHSRARDSLRLSLSLLLAPLAVSRSTRNAAIYTHVTRSSTAPPRSAREVDDSCTRAHATNFGEALSSRHFRCTGIPTMNELACVVIAPT